MSNKSYLLAYQVTNEPIPNLYISSLPESEQEEFEVLDKHLYTLLNDDPEQAIPEIKKALAQHPNYPKFYNYLSIAYQILGDQENLDRVIMLNYQKNPDYLFAKTMYAEFLIRSDRYQEIPEVFDNKFNLKLIYPDRDIFHITEVTSFMTILGLYMMLIGRLKDAKECYEMLRQLQPEGEGTQLLFRLLKDVVSNMPKISKNSACPCGSGKKYKRCCGAERTFIA